MPSIVERTLIRPPSSRLGAISDNERAKVVAASPIAGLYEVEVDRVSAFEILKKKAEAADELVEPEDEPISEREFSNARRYGGGTKYSRPVAKQKPKKSSRGDTTTEAFAKSLARSFGTQLGRSLGRGTLGSFFKKL